MKKLISLLFCVVSFSAAADSRCLPPSRSDCHPAAIPVLMYHQVTDAKPVGNYVISPRAFTLHLDAIKKAGYKTVTMSQVADYMRGKLKLDPSKTVALTFDDGWKDNILAATALHEQGMVGTFYVLSGVFSSPAYLTEDELRKIAEHHEIGAHTHTHFMEWADKLTTMDDRVMLGEIVMSKVIIEGVIKKPVKTFAWPFGYGRAKLNTLLAGAGFQSAALVDYGGPPSFNGVGDDPMQIMRITVTGGCTPVQLLELIETRKVGACNEEVSSVAQ